MELNKLKTKCYTNHNKNIDVKVNITWLSCNLVIVAYTVPTYIYFNNKKSNNDL